MTLHRLVVGSLGCPKYVTYELDPEDMRKRMLTEAGPGEMPLGEGGGAHCSQQQTGKAEEYGPMAAHLTKDIPALQIISSTQGRGRDDREGCDTK